MLHVVLAQELLTALLMQPVANLGMTQAGKDDQPTTCDITVADILGPLLKEAGTSADATNCSDVARDAKFSLLSYSFSLVPQYQLEPVTRVCSCGTCNIAAVYQRPQLVAQNPAIRHELSYEMGQMHSDTALHFGAAGDDTGIPVLPQEGKFYSKVPPRFMCVKNFGADNDDMRAASSSL